MINYLLIFLLTFLITHFTYIIIFYIKDNKNIKRSKYNFNTIVLSLSIAVVVTIMIKLIDKDFGFTTIFVFVILGLIEYNILAPMVFGKELIDLFKKTNMLAVVISKGLVLLYLFLITI